NDKAGSTVLVPIPDLDWNLEEKISVVDVGANPIDGVKTHVHICFNNIHVQPLLPLLADADANAGFSHEIFVEKARSVPEFDVNIPVNPHARFFHRETDLEAVYNRCINTDV